MAVLKWIDDHSEEFDADIWSFHKTIGSITDIMIPPKFQTAFEKFLKAGHVDFTIKIEDLQK